MIQLMHMATDQKNTRPAFHPSVWGDFFINYNLQKFQRSEEWMNERAQSLRAEVSNLFYSSKDVVGTMNLVDTLQRLGIDHCFNSEIVSAIKTIQDAKLHNPSLHEVALRFRLLRQHGIWASADDLNIFNSITMLTNPRGLLSLYNAAHLSTKHEEILEEACSILRHKLESIKSSLSCPLFEQVSRALEIPLPRAMRRLEALHYVSEYKKDFAHNPSILELAKIDYNLLQSVHLSELKIISRWWNDLYKAVGLSYTRDRVVECYLFSFGVYYEKYYSRARVMLAKIIALATLLDDTYDSYATLEECRELNEAIERWDESAISILPDYLKELYLKFMSTFKEFEDELEPNQKYRITYLTKALQTLSKYYLQEVEWCHLNYMPSFNDHLSVSVMSTAIPLLVIGSLVGMGDEATKQAFDWAISIPTSVKACSKIGRFVNDISSVKLGKNKGDAASTVECYMNEYKVTSKVAISKISSFIEDEWRKINQELLEQPTLYPIVQRVMNLAIVIGFVYVGNRDGYTFGNELQGTIARLFVKPIPI